MSISFSLQIGETLDLNRRTKQAPQLEGKPSSPEEVGKAFVRLDNWRWMSGMRVDNGARIESIDADLVYFSGHNSRFTIWNNRLEMSLFYPDINDAGTTGCILRLCRVVSKQPCLSFVGSVDDRGEFWTCVSQGLYASGLREDTEAEAMLRFLQVHEVVVTDYSEIKNIVDRMNPEKK